MHHSYWKSHFAFLPTFDDVWALDGRVPLFFIFIISCNVVASSRGLCHAQRSALMGCWLLFVCKTNRKAQHIRMHSIMFVHMNKDLCIPVHSHTYNYCVIISYCLSGVEVAAKLSFALLVVQNFKLAILLCWLFQGASSLAFYRPVLSLFVHTGPFRTDHL